MSASNPIAMSHPKEKTFTAFTAAQGAHYAQNRPGYHPQFYQSVVDQHTSTGGKLDTILDIGCGPGVAVRALAPHFQHAIGLDPSAGMIETAKALAGTTASNEQIRFDVSTAEHLGEHLSPAVPDASVDLITAATAAHWFDMTQFWPSAARVLKPGGTVALWSAANSRVLPATPNAEALQAFYDEVEEREIEPFFELGNVLTRNLYNGITLPWTLEKPVAEFDQSTFVRKEWNPDYNEEFMVRSSLTLNMDQLEKILATSSPCQRWREAHPETIGTEQEIIRRMRRGTERLLSEAGVPEDQWVISVAPTGVLLVLKKKV